MVLPIFLLLLLGIAGVVGYVIWNNSLHSNLRPKVSYINTTSWIPYEDRYAPISFKHPKEWEVATFYSRSNSMQINAFVNRGKENEKIVLNISYSKSYPNTNPNPPDLRGIADGVSVEPTCPYRVEAITPPDCLLVKNKVVSGYLYISKGRDSKRVVRWHGQTSSERLAIDSYEIDESTFAAVISSITNGPARNDRETLIPTNELTEAEQSENIVNASIKNTATSDLNAEKCDEIKGITYREDQYESSKVQILEEWQTLVDCRNAVDQAIKTYKGATLQGTDCSREKRFTSLRRILTNVKILEARNGGLALVETESGNLKVSYDPYYYQSDFPWFVDTYCEAAGSLHTIKAGDIISVYVKKDNLNPNAYENGTMVLQRVSNYAP